MVDKIMKKFEADKLYSSSNIKVKSRLQALAIGYSIAEKECYKHIDDVYLKRLKTKVDKFLFSENKKIKKGKISYSGVLDVIKHIELTNSKIYKKYLMKRYLLSIEFNTQKLNNKIAKLLYKM